MKAKLAPWIIALILFAIPFFWLKSGEMDLGGDSSRLYFYDPISYLKNYSLWSVSPSGFGTENIGFMTIPLVVILAAAKYMVSSTILISAFHGLSLATAFLFVYLSVRQLLETSENEERVKEAASVISGLLYVFSPISIFGWDKVLMTHNHVFLNPLMFYLLLRYFITDRFWYLLGTLVVTFIFSANFSFVAAPVFFAFYPLSLVFLLIYKRWVLGTSINGKQLLFAGVLFILLQTFHVLPQLVSMVTPGSVIYETVFSSEGKIDRGLNYFSAIAPSIKASINLLILPQMTEISKLLLFMVLVPITVIMGFIRNAKEDERFRKTLILTGGCFLAVFFFATANITDLGLSIYKKLFILPGFSIFRNYYGQWVSAYLFYYVLLFGIALSIVLRTYRKAKILLGVFLFFLIVNAWPFIKGELVNPVLWQSNNVRIAMTMDPAFVQAMIYMRGLPADGKVLTLPITDPGYQIVAGKDGGAYMGPSMVAYLAGKQDFAGADEVGRYRELLLDSVRDGNTAMLKRILGMLNIRYVFYNSDPRVYDAFPTFPYSDVRRFFPKRQEEYKRFVESLSLRLVASFDNRFYIYELANDSYAPRVYVPQNTASISRAVADASVPLSLLADEVGESVFFEGSQSPASASALWYPGEPQSAFLRMVKNPDPPRIMHHAFATQSPSSFLYPLVMLKENFLLYKRGDYDYRYLFDRRLFLSAKRVFELEQWGTSLSVVGTVRTPDDLKNAYREPGLSPDRPAIWNIAAWRNVNSWEASLARYYRYFDENIRIIEAVNESPQWKAEQRFLLSEYLLQHHRRLTELILQRDKMKAQRDYLEEVTDKMFGDLLGRVLVDVSDLWLPYSVQLPKSESGSYDVYLDKNTLGKDENVSVLVEGRQLQSPKAVEESRWVNLGTVAGSVKDFHVSLVDRKNLLTESSRISLETVKSASDSAVLTVDASYIKGGRGLTWKIDVWQPQSYYLLTFSYRTSGEPFVVRTLEGETRDGAVAGTNTLVEDMLKSPAWGEYQAVIRTNKYVNTGLIQIAAASDQSSLSRIELKDVSLIHLSHPLLVFKRAGETTENSLPKISYVQVDPTTYRVRVSGAVRPYFLLLSEATNRRWQVSVIPQRKVIANTRHFEANGYANAWYIEPADVGGRTDYELELYMSTQSYFYIGAGISLFMLVGLLFYGWRRYHK